MRHCRVQSARFIFILAWVITIVSQTFLAAEETETKVSGKTVYVKPSSEIVIRRGQGTDYKIIALVKDGSSLELLEEDESYAKVRLPNGKEGWVLSRFLSEEPPLDQLVLELRQQNDKASERVAAAEQKLEELMAVLNQTRAELSRASTERENAVNDYETLKKETADVIKIKTDLKEATHKKEELSQELAALKLENKDLSTDSKLYWFLGGAGVLLLGMLLGRMPAPTRRRKSSLI